MKIYIVNLPRCRDRRESILRECAQFELEPEILPGVDGQELTEAELQRLVYDLDRNKLSKPEIGCTLSHLGIYRDMIEKDIPISLVLEDDSVFNQDPRPILAALEQQPTDAPEVYLLTHMGYRYIDDGRPRQVGDIKFYRGWTGCGSYGYVITKKAAVNIYGFQTPLKYMCDWWKYFQVNDLLRFYICEKEIISMHPELGQAAASLMEKDRAGVCGHAMKKYLRHLRKQTPFLLRAKYFFFRLRHQFNIRCQ